MSFKVHHPFSSLSVFGKRTVQSSKPKDLAFKQIFEAELTNQTHLRLSKHAESRLQQRDIYFTSETWNKVEKAVYEAESKGVKEALVLTSDAALVVSTTKKVVITALDRKSANEHVFTNIDGTVVIEE